MWPILTYLLRTIADPKNLGSRLVALKKNVARVYIYIYSIIWSKGRQEQNIWGVALGDVIDRGI